MLLFYRILALFVLLFYLPSCVSRDVYHGYSYSGIELWDSIVVGDDKNKVISSLGLPALTSEHAQYEIQSWYYISYQIRKSNPYKQRKYGVTSLQLDIDSKTNKVKSITRLNKSFKNFVRINLHSTPAPRIDHTNTQVDKILETVSIAPPK